MKIKIKKKTIIYSAIIILILAAAFFLVMFLKDYGDKKAGNPIVVLETTKGNIEIELDKPNAPVSVDNFLRYVNEGFYEGTVFHRVIFEFMIQGGGFTKEGLQKQTHETIPLESDNGLKNLRGTIAMARTMRPDSATSQFYINVVDNAMLDYAPGNPGYAVFGKVISGMDVVDKIEMSSIMVRGIHENWPEPDVVITKAYLKE
ncbi:peptidylprolyl isomerase [Thermoproteota archaeon]